MSVLRMSRFTVDPTSSGEMLARRATMIDALRARFPGLLEAQLSRIDDSTWVDVWRWESRQAAEAAIQGAPGLPEVSAAFAVARDVTAEFAEPVDTR